MFHFLFICDWNLFEKFLYFTTSGPHLKRSEDNTVTVILRKSENPILITKKFWKFLGLFVIIGLIDFWPSRFLKEAGSFIRNCRYHKSLLVRCHIQIIDQNWIEIMDQDKIFITCREWANNLPYTFHLYGYKLFCGLIRIRNKPFRLLVFFYTPYQSHERD